jgi:histidine triad (HIT) family protein
MSAAMADCIFCKIAAGEIPVKKLGEDDHVVAFPDLKPQTPFHALVIPKLHVASLNDVRDPMIMGHLYGMAGQLARSNGFDKTGYRTVINTGADAQQTVFHVHLHVLAGRQMSWPPG